MKQAFLWPTFFVALKINTLDWLKNISLNFCFCSNTDMNKSFLLPTFLFIQILLPTAHSNLNQVCRHRSECGLNQTCRFGRCQCQNDTFLWHGNTCLSTQVGHGDYCHDQSECSFSGDPHLQCTTTTTDGKKRCLCRPNFHFTAVESGKMKCSPLNMKLSKMTPTTDKESRLLDRDGSTDHIWAPLIVILMALIVIILCCCFLRIDPRAPHTYVVDDQPVQEGKKPNDDEFDDIELGGIDNWGYDQQDEDTVSRHTATTVISEALETGQRQKKRSKIRTNPHVKSEGTLEKKSKKKRKERVKKEAPTVKMDDNGNEKDVTTTDDRIESNQIPEEQQSNQENPDIKHHESNELNPTKKISYESQISTESTVEITASRKIERVRTDDETSIDTTITPPQEENVAEQPKKTIPEEEFAP